MTYTPPLRATIAYLVEQSAAWDDGALAALARVKRSRAVAYLHQLVDDGVLIEVGTSYAKGRGFSTWRDARASSRPGGNSRAYLWRRAICGHQTADRSQTMRYAEALRAARRDAQLTMPQLAVLAGCSRSTICDIENAMSDPSQRTREALSRVLGIAT